MDKGFRVYDDNLSPILPTVIKHIEDTVFWYADVTTAYDFFKVFGESFDVKDYEEYDDGKEYTMDELWDMAESYYFEEVAQGYAKSDSFPTLLNSIKHIERQFEIDMSDWYPAENPHIDEYISWLVHEYDCNHFGRDLLDALVKLCRGFADSHKTFSIVMSDVLDEDAWNLLNEVEFEFF